MTARTTPLKTLLLWALPLVVFGWLAIASHASTGTGALPAPGTLLGGGAIGDRFVPLRNYALHFTTISVQPDGKRVRVYGDWNGRCKGYVGAVTASFFQEVSVSKAGVFKGKGPLESTVADGVFAFDGMFTTPNSASGTGRVTFTFHPSSGQSYACDTGTIKWETRSVDGSWGKPKVHPGAAYFGNTTQRLPVVLRVSNDGRYVTQQSVLWNATCKENTTGLGRGTSSPPIPVRDGAFRFTETYTETYGSFVAHITSTHSGRFGGSTVGGTWRIRIDVRDSNGRKADSCDSGRIRWAARL